MNSNKDTAYLWLTRFDPVEGLYLRTEVDNIQVVDTDGQVFATTHQGSGGTESFWQTHVELDFIPRRSETFKINLALHDQEGLSTVWVRNPVSNRSYPQWNPDPLPQSFSTNGYRFDLEELSAHASPGNQFYCRPTLRVSREGRDCSEWWTPTYEFSDATGNQRDRGLSFTESAWRLSVRMFPSAQYPFSADEIIELGRSSPPPAGASIELRLNAPLRAKGIINILLTGAGRFRLENGSTVGAEPWEPTMRNASSASSGSGNVWKLNHTSDKPKCLLIIDSAASAGLLPPYADSEARRLLRAVDAADSVTPLRMSGSHSFSSGAGRVQVHTFEWEPDWLVGMQSWQLIPVSATPMSFLVAPPAVSPNRQNP